MSEIWQACKGVEQLRPLKAVMNRLVESQEQVATTRLVDTADEQSQLESLLENSKPPRPPNAERYDYLIWTPFRYPPLSHGSRFGRRSEHGLFYGALSLPAAFAECAYYRFVFLSGMAVPLPVDRLTTEHSSFQARLATEHGIALEQAPFLGHAAQISNPSHYGASQALGTAMRDAGVEAFTYLSARYEDGVNVGVFRLQAIKSRKPERMHHWVCTTMAETVSFIRLHGRDEQPYKFQRAQYLVNDVLPSPAC